MLLRNMGGAEEWEYDHLKEPKTDAHRSSQATFIGESFGAPGLIIMRNRLNGADHGAV